jgi:hypothetical protein
MLRAIEDALQRGAEESDYRIYRNCSLTSISSPGGITGRSKSNSAFKSDTSWVPKFLHTIAEEEVGDFVGESVCGC